MSDIWYVGRWRVDFRAGRVTKRWMARSAARALDGRMLQVLRALVENAGDVVSTETLLERAWPDRVVGRDSVTTAIYQLRQLLEDTADNPQYIRSEARRGYRLVAKSRKLPAARLRNAAGFALISMVALAAYGAVHLVNTDTTPTVYVEPLINYAESPVQGPLFTAVENTLLTELIRRVPGEIKANGDGVRLRLQSMMVSCDLGPALVVRLLDTKRETYVWSKAYNLDEVAERVEGPTLVEEAAADVGEAVAAI